MILVASPTPQKKKKKNLCSASCVFQALINHSCIEFCFLNLFFMLLDVQVPKSIDVLHAAMA